LAIPAAEPTAVAALDLPPELLPFPAASPKRRDAKAIAIVAVRALVAALISLQLGYLLATALLVSVYRYVDPSATVLMAYRKWNFGWKLEPPRPVRLRTVPKYIRSMLVAIEDDHFYEHHGIEMDAFARAHEINRRLGRPLYGGSTLTMQLARTLFLVPEKSYIRKYLEVLTALELEALLPKARILELYFGYAEWGKGIFGIEAASRKWYGRGIDSITRDEAARLVALLSSPIKYGPYSFQRSLILRERYGYLSQRYDPQPEAVDSSSGQTEAPAGAAPASGAPEKPRAGPAPIFANGKG
jgi:monofunctional biosynthetic peptidoglycan transglycosylase